MKKLSSKTDIILSVILSAVCFILLVAYNKSYKSQSNNIEKNGIETTGMVVDKAVSRHKRGAKTYAIKYTFDFQGEEYFGFQEFANKWYYDNATEGMEYQVKFIKPEKSGLCKSARIYIDKPVINIDN